MLECHEVSHVEHWHAWIDCQGLGRRSLFGQNDGYWHTYILRPINFKASIIAIAAKATIMLVDAQEEDKEIKYYDIDKPSHVMCSDS